MLKILLTQDQIQQRVTELARQMTDDYYHKNLMVVGVLKGAFIFMSDLVRSIDIPLTCDFIRVSSYRAHRSTGRIKFDFDTTEPVQGKDVLLVEDIIDTGTTLTYLLDHLRLQYPSSLKVCSLLYKERVPGIKKYIDYIGFEIQDNFVVGYGLDYQGLYRSLSSISVLKNI